MKSAPTSKKTTPTLPPASVARIVSAVDRLSDLPAVGRVGRIKGTRELVLADIPYIVPYRVTQTIEILTVLHTSQRWPTQL